MTKDVSEAQGRPATDPIDDALTPPAAVPGSWLAEQVRLLEREEGWD